MLNSKKIKAEKELKKLVNDNESYKLTGVAKKGKQDFFIFKNTVTKKVIYICEGRVMTI